MFTQTKPKEVLLQDTSRSPASASTKNVGGVSYATSSGAHQKAAGRPPAGGQGGSATRSDATLPSIQMKGPAASEAVAAPHSRNGLQLPGHQKLPKSTAAGRHAASTVLPALGDASVQLSSGAQDSASKKSGKEVSSSARKKVPSRPSSGGRAASGRRPVESSPPRQSRQPSPGRRIQSPNSARPGSAGRSSGRRLSAQSLRKKALKSLKEEVESAEAVVGHLMEAGSIGEALELLSKTIKSMQDFQLGSETVSGRGNAAASTTSTRASSAGAKPSAPGAAWVTETLQRLAEVYTTFANDAGLWCNAAAGPIQVQEACFQTAMRYLVKDATENLFPEWTKSSAAAAKGGRSAHSPKQKQTRRRPARPTTKSPSGPPSCFPISCPSNGKGSSKKQRQQPAIVRRLLSCAVRTNAVVCLGDGVTPGGQARLIYELLKALAESDGVWCMTVLYNLAVAFFGIGDYDDAAEAIARFMELSLHYLNWAENFVAAEDDGDDANVAAAVLMHAALQLIRGHHFIAAMAAWCEPHGSVELYHCELASACAERYLSRLDRAQRDCQCRLAAAQARATTDTGSKANRKADFDQPPPFLLLPYITQDLILPSASPATTTEADGDKSTIVTMHVLADTFTRYFFLGGALPTEVKAYVQEVQTGESLRYWAQAAILAGASPPFLSASAAASTATPVPPALTVLLSYGDISENVWAHRSWIKSLMQGESSCDEPNLFQGEASATGTAHVGRAPESTAASSFANTPGGPAGDLAFSVSTAAPTPLHRPGSSLNVLSPLKPSKPAPLFVTSVPSSVFGRYFKLRNGIVSQVENTEHAEEETEKDVDSISGLPLSANVREGASPLEVPNSRLGTASTCLSGEGVSLRLRSGRVTALLVGASCAVTPLRGSISREGRCDDASAAFGLTEDVANDFHDTTSIATTACLDLNLLALPVRPSELLRKLDCETEVRYSRLIEDTLADLHRVASTCIQTWWRMHLAQRERIRRLAAVETRLEQQEAVICLQVSYRHWKERAPAKTELRRLRAERERVRCVTIIQAFVQQIASVETWGHMCLAWHKLLVEQRKIEQRRAAASVTLQSWWRMHMTRRWLCVSMAAATHIQCAWRCRVARHELRSRRVHRRLEQEKWRQERRPQIIFVQRWWRACCARWAVGDLLYRKQRSVGEYLTAQESQYEEVMRTHLRSVENVEAAMRCVLSVLAGARSRRQLGQLYRHALIRQRAVHRFVLLWCGRVRLQQLRHDHIAALALMKRREEVAVAVATLQSWARSWLPKRFAARQSATSASLNAHAKKIQAAFRHHRVRQSLVSGCAQRRQLEASRRYAEARDDAAVRVQSVWRMYRTQRELFDLFQFMLKDRHQYATAVQRRWRGHYARAVLAPQRGAYVTKREVSVQQRATLPCAAVRLQAFYRMYRTRIQLLRLGVRLLPNAMYRIAAASRIQRSWRAYAAYQRVLRLRLQRSYIQKQAHAQEALHAYATRIQAVFRSYLVRRRRSLPSESTAESLTAPTTVTEALVPHPPFSPRL